MFSSILNLAVQSGSSWQWLPLIVLRHGEEKALWQAATARGVQT